MKQPKISLCMIVKNEEQFLARCLESAKEMVDEVVVVDTGSTDRTQDIAADFGARVFRHPWENDFSKHRNQSIDYATGDWILWLDADEALEPGAGKIIRETLKSTSGDSLLATMVCYYENRSRESWNNSIKVFRNGSGIHFAGAVHNQVVGCKKTVFCPVKIHHYGYDVDPETIRKKFHRTSGLLKKAVGRDPDNFRHHHDLAVCYASIRRYRKAVSEGQQAISLYRRNRGKDPNILWTHFVVASAYFNLGYLDEAEATACEAIRIHPDHFDSHFVLASIYLKRNETENFRRTYQRITDLLTTYAEAPERLAGLVVNKIGEKWRLNIAHGSVLLGEGRVDEAMEWFDQAARLAPDAAVACRFAATQCREKGLYGAAEHFIDRAVSNGLSNQKGQFEKALLWEAAGRHDESSKLLNRLMAADDFDDPELFFPIGIKALKMGRYQRAESFLRSAADRTYETPTVLNALALACKYQGKTDDAIEWSRRSMELDPNCPETLNQLGRLYYDRKNWSQAKHFYERLRSADVTQQDALFKLSILALIENDLARCIHLCNELLMGLGCECDFAIEGIKDMGCVYRMIAESFSDGKDTMLHHEAMNAAAILETVAETSHS